MTQHKIKLLIALVFISGSCFSAVHSDDDKLIEELTGRSVKKACKKNWRITIKNGHHCCAPTFTVWSECL